MAASAGPSWAPPGSWSPARSVRRLLAAVVACYRRQGIRGDVGGGHPRAGRSRPPELLRTVHRQARLPARRLRPAGRRPRSDGSASPTWASPAPWPRAGPRRGRRRRSTVLRRAAAGGPVHAGRAVRGRHRRRASASRRASTASSPCSTRVSTRADVNGGPVAADQPRGRRRRRPHLRGGRGRPRRRAAAARSPS